MQQKNRNTRVARKKKPVTSANPPQIVFSPWLDVIVRFTVISSPTQVNELPLSGTLSTNSVADAFALQTGWTLPSDYRMCMRKISLWGTTAGREVKLAPFRLGSGAVNDPVSTKEAYGNPFRRAVVSYRYDPQGRVVQLTKGTNETIAEYSVSAATSSVPAVMDVHIVIRPLPDFAGLRGISRATPSESLDDSTEFC